MTRPVQYTLLGDGSSDRALVPVLDWVFRAHLPPATMLAQAQVADLGRLHAPPPLADLSGRIRVATEVYPCSVLFVHRDAEQADGYERRRAEVEEAIAAADIDTLCIPVIPVRMMEAWFLFDEPALRRAAGNPNGSVALDLPVASHHERVHAKDALAAQLRRAAALTGRRARQFRAADAVQRLANLVDDFSALRHFSSFRDLERDVRTFCDTLARS